MGRRVLLFCFPMSHKKDARLIWVNVSDQIKEVGEIDLVYSAHGVD